MENISSDNCYFVDINVEIFRPLGTLTVSIKKKVFLIILLKQDIFKHFPY